MLKRFLTAGLIFWMLLQTFPVVETSGNSSFQAKGVIIRNKGNYYSVSLDYRSGLSRRQMGETFAKGILGMVPDYESLIDSYIAENLTKYEYRYAFYRLQDIKPQINRDYAEEIAGMASVFSGGNRNRWGDRKVSGDEIFLFNLFTDVVRGSQCSYVSVFGSRSQTHKTITARNLDWYGGSKNQLPRIQAIVTFIYPGKKVCSIGYLGYMGILTGFNDRKMFAGILDAGSNASYTSEGRRSYPLDLRYALENCRTMNEAAEYMRDPRKLYTYNHLIGFSDPESSVILENNFSGNGPAGHKVRRMLRNSGSRLNNKVNWGIDNAVAAVNSFVLYGNYDNHTSNQYNIKRWKNIKTQLLGKGPAVTAAQLKEVIIYNHGSPGTFSENGDIYNKMTLQMVIFQPDTLSLEVFFRPKNSRKNPIHPVFYKISVFH
jgi:hypothetical protein